MRREINTKKINNQAFLNKTFVFFKKEHFIHDQ